MIAFVNIGFVCKALIYAARAFSSGFLSPLSLLRLIFFSSPTASAGIQNQVVGFADNALLFIPDSDLSWAQTCCFSESLASVDVRTFSWIIIDIQCSERDVPN